MSNTPESLANTQTAPGAPLETLQSALASAYSTNPNLLAARAQQRALDESIPQASAGWKPTVQLSGQWGLSNSHSSFGPGPAIVALSHPITGTGTITQPVFKGGRTFFGVRQAEHNVEAGRERLRTTEEQTLLSAVTDYFNVIQDSATVSLNANNVSVLQRQLDETQDRFRVGELTRTDVAQAQARLQLADTTLVQSQAQLIASQDAYKTVVGHAPGNLDASPPMPVLPKSIEDAQAIGVQNSPDLEAARETEKAANDAVKVAVGALLPSLSVVAQASHSGGQKSSFGGLPFNITSNQTSVTGELTVPIYQAGSEYASIRQAKHTASQDRLLTVQSSRTVQESIANAWEQLLEAGAAIKSNREQVAADKIAYDGVVQEEQVGERTTLDVLNAEQELLNSQVSLVQSQRDQYVAAFTVLSAIGELTPQQLGLPVDVYDPTANTRSLIWKQVWPGAGE
jgi:outer membrane protein